MGEGELKEEDREAKSAVIAHLFTSIANQVRRLGSSY
jgi:hypothetical protein